MYVMVPGHWIESTASLQPLERHFTYSEVTEGESTRRQGGLRKIH